MRSSIMLQNTVFRLRWPNGTVGSPITARRLTRASRIRATSSSREWCFLLFAGALIAAFCSSRERSSLLSALRASAHRCFLLFARALIAAFCSSRERSSLLSALRASAHRCSPLVQGHFDGAWGAAHAGRL